MSQLIGSQQMPQSMATQSVSQTVAVNQPTVGTSGPTSGSVPHNYGMTSQSAPNPQSGQQSNEQNFNLITKVRQLVLSLKESLATLMKVSAGNIIHNSQIDSGLKTSEESVARFDKAMEDFFSICNQIELHLKTLLECTIQSRDSQMYLNFNVNKTDNVSDTSNMNSDSMSYNQYLMTIKSQVNFAKTIHDMLIEGSKRITQTDLNLNSITPGVNSSVPTPNTSVV